MSKGFAMKNGDVVVFRTIEMVEGDEHLRVKCELVVGTNKGEWGYDKTEGIDFFVVLRKNPDDAEIRGTIEEALKGIDETFTVTKYNRAMRGRDAEIEFTAVNSDGVEVGGVFTYGS